MYNITVMLILFCIEPFMSSLNTTNYMYKILHRECGALINHIDL